MKRLVLFLLFFLWSLSASAASNKRIVSLAPSVTEILFAIGAGDQVVGVTTYCEYPEEAKLKPKVGGFTEHNLEAIVMQKPDLVMITPNRGSKFTYEELNQIGVESLVVPFYSLQDLVDSYRLIGEKIGNWAEAKKIQDELLKTIEEVRNRSIHRSKKKVAFVSWQSPLILPARGSLEGDAIELAGGENMVKDTALHYPKVGIETFFKEDPDLIIDASSHGREMSLEERRKMVKNFWRLYPKLRAVQSGQVFLFKGDVYSVPGPRTARFIKAMDAILDPAAPSENEYYERVQF